MDTMPDRSDNGYTQNEGRADRPEERGGEMFHRLIEAMRESTATSGFEGYLRSLSAHRVSGGPTVNEARRDYRAALRRR